MITIRRTTTTTTVETSVSHLNKHERDIYERAPSPYPTPIQALERKIQRIAHYYNITEEEATHLVLHSHV